jgi:hypothetical protein
VEGKNRVRPRDSAAEVAAAEALAPPRMTWFDLVNTNPRLRCAARLDRIRLEFDRQLPGPTWRLLTGRTTLY